MLALESEALELVVGEEVEAELLELGETLREESLVLVSVRLALEEAVEPKEEPVEAGDVVLEAAGSAELLELFDAPLNGLALLASVGVEVDVDAKVLLVVLLLLSIDVDEAELDDGVVELPTWAVP